MIEGMQEIINTILAVEKRILSTIKDQTNDIEYRLTLIEKKLEKIEEIALKTQEELDTIR